MTLDVDINQLRDLMQALRDYDFHEVSVQRGEQQITLKRAGGMIEAGAAYMSAASIPVPPSARPPIPSEGAPAPAESTAPPVDDHSVFITSPFVGTFYRSPSPDAEPFVHEGQKIKPGQALCIIEAMKLMNEIESEVRGTIAEVLVENGKPVEFGEKLFRVTPSS